MTQVMVRYRVKPEHAADNEQLVCAVYDELQRTEPSGIPLRDVPARRRVMFVHLSCTESDDGQTPLAKLESFQRFQDNIGDRYEEPPLGTWLRETGSYRLFSGQGKS
jgi:hypothetical protein